MELKRTRLRNLVNKEFSFYPKNSKNDDCEIINRYDSDEELRDNDSDYEEGYDLHCHLGKDKDKEEQKEEKQILQSGFKDSPKSEFEDCEKNFELLEITNRNSKIENFSLKMASNELTDLFSSSFIQDDLANFLDEEIIKNLQELNKNEIREEEVKKLSEKICRKLNLECLDSVIFYANCIHNIFSLLLINSKKDKNFYDIENVLISTSEKIFNWYIDFMIEQDKTSKTRNFSSKSNSNQENPFIQKILRLKTHLIKLSDYILEHLIKSEKLNERKEIVNLILHSLPSIDFSSKNNLLRIITNLNQIFKGNESNNYQNSLQLQKNSFQFTKDQIKNLFNLCFSLIKNPKFSNHWIDVIDLICNIIRSDSSNEFNEKFIEYMITLFKEFCDYYFIPNEKFYLLDRKILNTYKNYFGIYKCLNGDTIAIYTLLFLKFFSIIYIKDSNNEIRDESDSVSKSTNFLKSLESFLYKLLDTKINNLLLVIFCLLEDILQTKYNIEFSVNMVLLTNMFLYFYNIITTQSEIEINRKKYFLNCVDFILENLLEEFKKIKDMYHCIELENNHHLENEAKTQCECFACFYASRNIIKDNLFFSCSLCKVKTNLKVQIINPEFDSNIDICAFCNMKKFFETVGALNFFSSKTHIRVFKNSERDSLEEINGDSQKQTLKEDNGEIRDKTKNQKKRKNASSNLNINYYDSDDGISNKDNTNVQIDDNNYYDKLLKYQYILYKENLTFIQSNLLNFLIQSNKNEISSFSNNMDISFQIFINILISEPKINQNIKNTPHLFSELIQFYQNQKGRIFNQLPDLMIHKETINYFYFYYFYINFLFAGHLRTLDILLSPDFQNFLPWNIRHKALKILEKFLIFEGEKKIFLNFQFDLLGSLLNDSSFYIREYSLEILFKLYKFKKINKNVLISTLFENINEASFLIRKRIIKALINLLLHERDEDLDNFKTVNYIFLNKIMDHSESIKIKNLIYEFYGRVINQKNSSGLYMDMIEILIEILEENEDPDWNTINSNIFYEHVKNLFCILIEDKKFLNKQKDLTAITEYIFENYILVTQSSDNNSKFIQALNIIKIISNFNQESLSVYFEFLIEFLKPSDTNRSDSNSRSLNENKIENKIKQIICEIFSNILQNNSLNVKSKFIYALENYLIILILSKPNHVMISALDCYFKILSRNIMSYDKIKELACKNYLFLKSKINSYKLNCQKNKSHNITIDDSSSNKSNRNKNKNSLQQFMINSSTNSVPPAILSKSLILLSYVTYLSNPEQIIKIFDFLESYKIFQQQSGLIQLNGLEKVICENIFSIYKEYCLGSNIDVQYDLNNNLQQNRIIKFKSFEALGFFFIRFPSKLPNSKEMIDSILKDLKDDEEKLIILRTFNNFFNKIENNIKESQSNKKLLENLQDNSDYGNIHLFFENFLQDISRFVVNEHNPIIRIQSIYLLKQIIDSGNISLHNVLPFLFAALFDYKHDVRHIAANLIEKIIKNSKDKFLCQMKECLKVSYAFQKRIYVEPRLINTFIKEINTGANSDLPNKNLNTNFKYEFNTNDENVFELLTYKLGKSLKDDSTSFNKKILKRFIQVFQEIKNFDNSNYNSKFVNFEESLAKFEFYEFVCDLIADFKFSNSLEVFSIFESLIKDFDTQYLVFKTKLKEYKKSDSIKKIDERVLLQFLICTLQISLLKFLAAKYENFDSFEHSIFEKKEFEDILQKIENLKEVESGCLKKKSSKKDFQKLSINKEFRNFKFFQFYKAFSLYYKKIFSIASKNSKNFKKNDKIRLIKLLNLSKELNKMKISDLRNVMSKFKRKANKLDEESQTEILSNLLFNEYNVSNEEKEVKKNLKFSEDNYQRLSRIKNNKRRVSLIEKDEDEENDGTKVEIKESFEDKKKTLKNKKDPINKNKTDTDRKSLNRKEKDKEKRKLSLR